MKNLVNTEYITLENLLDSVKGDFKKYSSSGIIDEAGLYKIVAKCNAEAGIRINPIEYCVADIKDGKIEMPEGLKKIKKIDIISNFKYPTSTALYQNWTETVLEKPKDNTPLYTPLGCMNDCNQCYWVIPYREKPIEQWTVFTQHDSLYPSNSCGDLKDNGFFLNRDESIIEFGVKSGKVILCYYIDLDTIGLIPKQSQLYFYYEWSVKVKILQDIFMNSEDDVVNKLQYAERQLLGAYLDFDAYIKSESFRQSLIRYKRQEQEFWDKWFSPIM